MPTQSGISISPATRKLLRDAIFAEHGRAARIAAEIGIDRRHLYSILHGRKRPSEQTLRALCRAAGLKLRLRQSVDVGPA